MFNTIRFLIGLAALCAVMRCQGQNGQMPTRGMGNAKMADKARMAGKLSGAAATVTNGPVVDRPVKTKAEYKNTLSAQEYHVMFEEGTERAYTGALLDNHRTGEYLCRACGNQLFSSKTKFESGTGWPSFYQAVDKSAVVESGDGSLGVRRTAVNCARCHAHLGHVFDDGPQPTGLRYCMNSVALEFLSK